LIRWPVIGAIACPGKSVINKYVLEAFARGTRDCTIIDCVIINRSTDGCFGSIKKFDRSASNLLLIPMYNFSSEKRGSTIGRVQVF
jgi:hypothetical protein